MTTLNSRTPGFQLPSISRSSPSGSAGSGLAQGYASRVSDTVTSYNYDFPRKSISPPKMIRQDRRRDELVKFDAVGTYKEDFKPWDSKRTDALKQPPPASSFQPPSGPFVSVTNYCTDYVPHNVTPNPALRPRSKVVARPPLPPFVDESTYRQHFMQHGVTPRDEDSKTTIKALQEMSNVKSGMIGSARVGNKREGSVTSSNVKSSNVNNRLMRQGTPETKPTYQQWRTQRPYLRERESDKDRESEGNVDPSTLTTSRREYGRKFVGKTSSLRRADSKDLLLGYGVQLPLMAASDNTTTYLEHYRKWITDERARAAVLQGNRKVNNDDQWHETAASSYKSDFVSHVLPPRQPLPRRTDQLSSRLTLGVALNLIEGSHTLYSDRAKRTDRQNGNINQGLVLSPQTMAYTPTGSGAGMVPERTNNQQRRLRRDKSLSDTTKTDVIPDETNNQITDKQEPNEVQPVLEQHLAILDDGEALMDERPKTARFVNNYGFEFQRWADQTASTLTDQ